MRGDAQDFVTRFKASAAVAPEFLAAWARLVADLRSTEAARKLFEDPLFRVEALRAQDPVVLYRVRRLSGDRAESLLKEVVDRLVSDGNRSGLNELFDVLDEEGRLEDLKSLARVRSDTVLDEALATRRHSRTLSRGRRS